jgi:hypothetical protein
MDLGEFGLIHERAKHIPFLYVDHHNFVYEKSAVILKKWEMEIED